MATRKYTNLGEHLQILEKKGLLVRVAREINKDTELHPLVRWQFRSNLPDHLLPLDDKRHRDRYSKFGQLSRPD